MNWPRPPALQPFSYTQLVLGQPVRVDYLRRDNSPNVAFGGAIVVGAGSVHLVAFAPERAGRAGIAAPQARPPRSA